ncbi:hypothetical protein PIB30_110429, partial [Stylosanthes scabra]|nr:hypothetical protein [Stylosanthes scabra]
MVVMSRLLPDHVVQRLATGPGRVGPITDLMSSLAIGQTCIICICSTLVVIACVVTGIVSSLSMIRLFTEKLFLEYGKNLLGGGDSLGT